MCENNTIIPSSESTLLGSIIKFEYYIKRDTTILPISQINNLQINILWNQRNLWCLFFYRYINHSFYQTLSREE